MVVNQLRRNDREELPNCGLVILPGLFDYKFHIASNRDVPEPTLGTVKHYLIHRGLEEQAPSTESDGAQYLLAYPDIRTGAANLLVHSIGCAAAEGRLDAVQSRQPSLAGARRGPRGETDLAGTTTKLAAALQAAGVEMAPHTPPAELRHVHRLHRRQLRSIPNSLALIRSGHKSISMQNVAHSRVVA